MANNHLDPYVKFANKLADISSGVLVKYYRNFGEVDLKTDQSPVTIADRKVESAMRSAIKEYFPAHGIQGEEYGNENEGAQYRWVLDPIDGTISFTIGRPIFGTLIALLEDEKPVIGVINQPITGERWLGVSGNKTKFNNNPTKTRDCESLKKAIVATTSPEYYSKKDLSKLEKLKNQTKYIAYGGDCYLYGLVASGHLDIAIDCGLKPHDYLPLVPIIEGAGGVITDWQGKPVNSESKGDIITSGSKSVHEAALKAMNG